MNVNSFVLLYTAKTKNIKNITLDECLSIIQPIIKPKSYLAFDEKLRIVDKTVEQCEHSSHPTADRYRHFLINLINAYTELDCRIKDFDTLCENKLLDVILSSFKSEYEICSNLLQMYLEDYGGGRRHGI